MRFLVAVLLGAALPCAASSAADRVLRTDRLDAVQLGMSVAEAERGLGTALKPETGDRNGSCWYAVRTDGVDPGIAYMIENGRVARIDLYAPMQAPAPTIATASGLALNATMEDLRRRYPAVQLEPHPIAPHSQWAMVEGNDQGGIRVQILDDRVVAIWSGRSRTLDYPEGCS